MLPVLVLGLLVILCFGVGWRVVSRLRTKVDALERNAAAVEQSFVRDDDAIVDLYNRVESLHDRLLAHECKPSAVAHSKPAAKKAPAKAAPVKKAAAKKAPVRAR